MKRLNLHPRFLQVALQLVSDRNGSDYIISSSHLLVSPASFPPGKANKETTAYATASMGDAGISSLSKKVSLWRFEFAIITEYHFLVDVCCSHHGSETEG